MTPYIPGMDYEKISMQELQEKLTFGESDSIEQLSGFGLATLQTERQSMLYAMLVIIGLRRQGISMTKDQVMALDPNEFIVVESNDEAKEENPTDAS